MQAFDELAVRFLAAGAEQGSPYAVYVGMFLKEAFPSAVVGGFPSRGWRPLTTYDDHFYRAWRAGDLSSDDFIPREAASALLADWGLDLDDGLRLLALRDFHKRFARERGQDSAQEYISYHNFPIDESTLLSTTP
jgi:hypothetical protein